MDSLTQIVLGAAVGEAVGGRKMGAKAALWGAIGGTIPDLDVFLRSFYHPFDAALVHRGFSHSLLFALLAGPLLGWLFTKRTNPKRSKWNWAGIIWSSGYLLWGVIVKLVILSQATGYFQEGNHQVKNAMVTPMPLTSFYWQMISEDSDNYYVGYKSLFAEFNPDEIQTIPKNHALFKQLKWKDKDRNAQLLYITNGYCALEQSKDTIRCYDLRFGTLKQITAGALNQPLMGYGMIVDRQVVQKSFRLSPGDAFKAINFGNYIDKVFGK